MSKPNMTATTFGWLWIIQWVLTLAFALWAIWGHNDEAGHTAMLFFVSGALCLGVAVVANDH